MTHDDVARTVEWALLMAHLPTKESSPAGVLLVDSASDQLHIKLLPELRQAHEEVAEFWRELPQELMERSRELGGARVLDWLETTASHLVQLGSRARMETTNLPETLDLLYRKHVTSDVEIPQPAERGFQRGAGR
jgi:hypothetical protein